jgi:hypothetical protein
MMIIDASLLTSSQLCRRRYVLEMEQWVPLRWQPRSLLNHCLRIGIAELCLGLPAAEAAKTAQAELLEHAANPGMDTKRGVDPYTLAMDYCAMLQTVLRNEFRSLQPHIPQLHLLPNAPVSVNCEWRFTAQQDDKGMLHRWVFWDAYSEDRLSRELHSWFCFGDIAMAKAPMMLHVILLGRRGQSGRQESPWCRAYRLTSWPTLKVRFKRRGNRGFAEGWKPTWLADNPDLSADVWVDQLWLDGVAQTLTRRLNVTKPLEPLLRDARQQIAQESERIAFLHLEQPHYLQLPMSRAACDLWVPCPFQALCHRADVVRDPADTGLYHKRGEVMEV